MPLRRHVVLETGGKPLRLLGPVFLFVRFPDECLAHVLSLPCDVGRGANGGHIGSALKPVGQRNTGSACARGRDRGKLGGCGASSGPLPSRSLESVTMISSLTVPTH